MLEKLYPTVAMILLTSGFALLLVLWNRKLGRNGSAATRKLHQSKAFFRTLIETLPDLVWLKDLNGVYLICNHKFERFFGATEAEIVGKTDYDFVDRELADFFRKNDKAAIAADKPVMNEQEVTYKDDGHIELLETIKTPMYDFDGRLIGVLGIARDITNRQRMVHKLENSEKQLQSIVRFLPDANFVIDSQGTVIAWNRAMEKMTGVDSIKMLGKNNYEYAIPFYRNRRPILIDLVLEGSLDIEKKYITIKRKGDLLTGEAIHTHLNQGKGLHTWAIAKRFYDREGTVAGAIETIRDIL